MTAAKAVVAFIVSFIGALLIEWQGGPDVFHPRDLLVAFVVAGSVYMTRNRATL